MKHASAILTVAVIAAWMPIVAAPADAAEGKGEVRGTFLRLAEKQIGEREHLVMVIKPLEGDDEVIVVLPRRSKLRDTAQRLRKGQKVEIAFVREGEDGWMWATALAAERLDRDERKEGERRRKGEREIGERGKGERERRRAPGSEGTRTGQRRAPGSEGTRTGQRRAPGSEGTRTGQRRTPGSEGTRAPQRAAPGRCTAR